jgi:3-hydroxyisobutyrate dehydrogenase-like beta-hydroxyacid dehydrogenase
MRRIGIIGVGLLGSAFASRLLAKGFQVARDDTRRGQITAMDPSGLIAVGS